MSVGCNITWAYVLNTVWLLKDIIDELNHCMTQLKILSYFNYWKVIPSLREWSSSSPPPPPPFPKYLSLTPYLYLLTFPSLLYFINPFVSGVLRGVEPFDQLRVIRSIKGDVVWPQAVFDAFYPGLFVDVRHWVYSLQVPKPFNSLSVNMLYWRQTFHLSDLLTSDILACLILLVALCKHPISQVVILNFCLLVIVTVWLWYISVMSVCLCGSENGVN